MELVISCFYITSSVSRKMANELQNSRKFINNHLLTYRFSALIALLYTVQILHWEHCWSYSPYETIYQTQCYIDWDLQTENNTQCWVFQITLKNQVSFFIHLHVSTQFGTVYYSYTSNVLLLSLKHKHAGYVLHNICGQCYLQHKYMYTKWTAKNMI